MSPLDEMLYELREIYNPNSEAAAALAKSMQAHPASGPSDDATVHNLDDYRDQLGLGGRS